MVVVNQYLTTFEVEIPVALSDMQRQRAFRTLNNYYVGKEQIPLKEFIPDKLRDAAYSVCRTTYVKLTVGVKLDGSLEVINDD